MKKFSFDFSLDAWIQNVEVEAKTLEEAKDILRQMSIDEMLETGYVKSSDIEDLDYEIEEDDYSEYDDVEYDRKGVEREFDLDDGELDGLNIREAEEYINEEEGALDRYIIEKE